MLEQESQNQEINSNFNENQEKTSLPPQTQTLPEDELFEQYEIKSRNLSPRIYQIAAISAVFNILVLFIFAQGNLLTTRGCESPIVSKVCQVLDTVYIGSTLLGTDSEFVSKDYVPTELGVNDEIIYVNVDSPPLDYPEGYFALANPEEFALRQQQQEMMLNAENPTGFEMPPSGSIPFPGIPQNQPIIPGRNDFKNIKPVFPKPNKNSIVGELPTSTSSGTSTTSNPNRNVAGVKNRPKKNSPSTNETAEDLEDETAKIKKPNPDTVNQPKSNPVKEVEINKQPFENLGDTLNEKLAKNEIDLNQPFTVVLDGVLNEEGKFDPKKSNFIEKEEKGDKKMIEVARTAIQAIGDSGFLGHLKNIGVEKMKITLIQDDKQIYAIVSSDQKSNSKAGTIASNFNILLSGLKLADSSGIKKLDDNSLTLVKNSTVTNDGRNFVLNFTIPKQEGQALINKSLKDRAEKKTVKNSNSSSEVNTNTTAKSGK